MIEYIELNKRLTCVFMRLTENVLHRIIRGLVLESSGNNDYYGKEVSLNLGDVISIDREDNYIKVFNKGVDMMSLIGGEFKVVNLHIQVGDESENPMLYCEVEDDISGESIKYIPCYSNAISVVERSEQMNDLNVGDLLYVLDIDENYFKVKNVQEKLGTSYRIVRLQKHKYFADTRYAFVVPEGAGDEDYSEMLIVPLVEGYVERV